ncbi:MAG: tetratricopeptide repeat protein [Acaryochloridaceae cyanobacterium RU_4_10]|nr:tetratricopeptide repeat protein [Acaryochloridaceae cyanobacterium RU_4_10]
MNRWSIPAVVLGVSAVLVVVRPHIAVALSSSEVNGIARRVTVRIISLSGSGSGVLIRKDGKTYTILTSAHVLLNKGTYEVLTPDGQRYSLDPNSIKKHNQVDLAIAQFSSPKSYPIVEIGDSSAVAEGSPSYVAGFPARTEAITESIYNFSKGEVTGVSSKPFKDGYSLIYTNTTLPGMSGGPVLDANGRLIGIHGRSDAKTEFQDQQLNPKIFVKSGVNLGIPINALFSVIPKNQLTIATSSSIRSNADQSLINDLLAQSNFRRRQNDVPGAIAALDQVIRLDPNNLNAFNERGSLYLQQQDFLAAVVDFRQTVQIDPNFAEGYYNQGWAQLRSGDPKAAAANFRKAAAMFKAQGKTEKYKATKERLKGMPTE